MTVQNYIKKFYLLLFLVTSNNLRALLIDVTIGKRHDWAIVSDSSAGLIVTKKVMTPRVVIFGTLTTRQYYDLIFAIEAGRKVAQQQNRCITNWILSNGRLKEIH